MASVAFSPDSVKHLAVFFVGGIMNEEEHVQRNALALSKKCNEVIAIVSFWNMTWRKKLTERIEFEKVKEDFSSRLIESLATGHSICIIAHSHGAKLVKEALKSLSDFHRKQALKRVEAYTFGGVTKIPTGYAKKVKNYRNETDRVLLIGEALWDEKESEPDTFTTVRGFGIGHQFVEGYVDLAAKKIKNFVSRYMLSNPRAGAAPKSLDFFPFSSAINPLDSLKSHLENYKKLFSENWREALKSNSKEQFFELLFFPLRDLALYFGCQKLNMIEVIDELPCFTAESRPLLKEALSFLCTHDKQGEEMPRFPADLKEYIRFEEKDGFLLEAAYLLVLSPFYSYLDNLFVREESAIEGISLLDLAFEKAYQIPESSDSLDTICHLASFLAHKENPSEHYYKQLSEKNLERLREVYCKTLQEAYRLRPENGFLKTLISSLEKIPDSSGNRLILKSKRSAFLQKLSEITSDKKILKDKRSVRICSPFFGERYLHSEVLDGILEEDGRIKKQMQNTNSRVSAYEKGGIAFHFKEKAIDYKKESPFHPGREHAAAELMFRLFGRGTSISELFEFEVEIPNKDPQKYLVLISETVPGISPDPENPPPIDPIQLSELFLSLPLFLPGDMRPANLITTPESELISVDNDVSWIKPYTREGCELYTILPLMYPEHILHPDAIEAFLALKPASLLIDWLKELIAYNSQMLSDFPGHEKIPEKKAFFSSVYYTSTCCFERGTGAQLLLQFHYLQEFLRKNKERPIQGIEILQAIISMAQDTTISVGTKIYDEYQKANERQDITVADKIEVVTRRKVNISAKMSASTKSFFQKLPQNKDELFHAAPEHALEEIINLSILKINETDGLFLKIGEFSSLHLQRLDAFKDIDFATQKFLFKKLLLHQFECLNLSYSTLEDNELESLLEQTGKHLKVLDLRNCSNLTKKSIESINQHCFILEELYLSRCDKIEHFTIGFPQFQVELPKLKILHLVGCPKLQSFKIYAPKLISFKVTETPPCREIEEALYIVIDNLKESKKKEEAFEYYEQYVHMKTQRLTGSFNTPSEEVADLLYNFWMELEKLGRNDFERNQLPEKYYLQCFEMKKNLLKWLFFKDLNNELAESFYNDLAESFYNLGEKLEKFGKDDEALECYQQSFQITKRLLKDQAGAIINAINMLDLKFTAYTMLDAEYIISSIIEGDWRAERAAVTTKCKKDVLKLKKICEDPREVLADYFVAFDPPLPHLAVMPDDKALRHHREWIGMKKQLFKDLYAHVDSNLSNLQEMYWEEYLDGEKIELNKAYLSQNLTDSLQVVGKNLEELGRNDEALEFYKKCLEIYKLLSKDRDQNLAYFLSKVALSLQRLERNSEDLSFFLQASRIDDKQFNEIPYSKQILKYRTLNWKSEALSDDEKSSGESSSSASQRGVNIGKGKEEDTETT